MRRGHPLASGHPWKDALLDGSHDRRPVFDDDKHRLAGGLEDALEQREHLLANDHHLIIKCLYQTQILNSEI